MQKEIEKVKKRREEREIERARQEEELSMLARERAIAEGFEMEKKEEEVGHPFSHVTIPLVSWFILLIGK
jgi:hypothetical protein